MQNRVAITITRAMIIVSVLSMIMQSTILAANEVTVGRILPLTGPAASYGKSEYKGTMLALGEVNAAGGINGQILKIIFEDDQCSVKEGVNAMKKLVEIDKVPAVLGATCSGVTLAIAPIANTRKVLLLSPLSSAAAITNAGPFVFKVMPSDAFQSRILAKWIFTQGYKKIAMLYINNAWGQGVSEEFKIAFKKLGGVIILAEACKEGDRDFRIQLSKIKNAQPAALFCPTMPKEGGIILKQMKELGLKLPVFGADAWSVEELLETAGSAAEGVMYTYPTKFIGPEYQAFAAVFRQKYGEDPDVNAAGAYDAVKILAMCMNRVVQQTKPLTGDNLRREMHKVKDYPGATGATTFDEHGDPIGKTFDKMTIRGGKRVEFEQ